MYTFLAKNMTHIESFIAVAAVSSERPVPSMSKALMKTRDRMWGSKLLVLSACLTRNTIEAFLLCNLDLYVMCMFITTAQNCSCGFCSNPVFSYIRSIAVVKALASQASFHQIAAKFVRAN